MFHNTTPDVQDQDQDQDHSVQDQDKTAAYKTKTDIFGLRPVLS